MLNLSQTSLPRCFEGLFTFVTTNTGASDYIAIPADTDKLSVSLKVLSTCVAKVQYTITPTDSLASADWIDWDAGTTTGGVVIADSTTGPISAIRLYVDTALAGNQATISVKTIGGL